MMRSGASTSAFALLGAFALLAPVRAHCQTTVPGLPAADSTPHHRALFTRSDPWIIGGFLAGAAVMRPLDKQIANEIREPESQTNRLARRTAKTFNFLGSPGTLIGGVALYGVGRIGHFDKVADIGLHGTEAVLVSAGITYVLKGITGRERPSHAGVNDPDDFAFGGGFTSGANSSFPSGHATAAFAAATMVTLETHRWSHKSTWFVAPVMFGGATMVGVARLYSNAHWASDVVMGAGIGTLTALKVFRYNHVTTTTNRADRWLLRAVPAVTPGPDGHSTMLSWSFPAPR